LQISIIISGSKGESSGKNRAREYVLKIKVKLAVFPDGRGKRDGSRDLRKQFC
jgi:hypothetical protein